MKQTDYVQCKLAYNEAQKGCVLGQIQGTKERPRTVVDLWEGISLIGTFPANLEFPMNPEFPENLFLSDCLINRYYLLVGSNRVKSWFESRNVPLLEYHPVTIRDHEGTVASREYWIINPLRAVDCLDAEKSHAVMISRTKNVLTVKQFILDESKLPEDRPFFRILTYSKCLLMRKTLAQELEKEKFTGIAFKKI